MRNLAGKTTAHANAYIEDELTEACIPIAKGFEPKGEVVATIRGECGEHIFTRAWTYWIVTDPVPIGIANELYCNPRGTKDVRVAGHCGCPEPVEPWINTRKNPPTVDLYHIDTQDGLNLFAERVLGVRPLPPTIEEKEAAKEIARKNHSGMIVFTDTLEESDYLAACQEVKEIRSALSILRRRLSNLSRLAGDEVANTATHILTAAIATLYELENPADARSFASRAKGRRNLWEDLYANPTNYVLKEKTDER